MPEPPQFWSRKAIPAQIACPAESQKKQAVSLSPDFAREVFISLI